MQISCAVTAGYTKKCLVEYLQDFCFNFMQLSNTNPNANIGPSAFKPKLNLLECPEDLLLIEFGGWRFQSTEGSLLAGGEGAFLESVFEANVAVVFLIQLWTPCQQKQTRA